MKLPRTPHRWRVTPTQAIAIQRRLAASVVARGSHRSIRRVAGVDAAFPDRHHCVAAAVVWDVRRGELLDSCHVVRPLTFPYVPGLLSFREAPAILAALRTLDVDVDAIICDGHGLAHPRGFGLACHLGVICDLTAIGCAKSRLVGEHHAPAATRGARAPLRHRGRRVGTVLRTRQGVRPVYVSVGHRIALADAATLVLRCTTRYRLPEPTRLADALVYRLARSAR